MEPVQDEHNRHSAKVCYQCGSTTTSLDKTMWSLLPHWYRSPAHGFKRPICKNCYVRNWWEKKYVPKDARCDLCGGGPYPNMERLFGYGIKKEKINSIAKDVS